MIAGLVLMTAGVTRARIMRKRPGWLRGHRARGACGARSVLFGVSAAVAMGAGFGGPHFQVLHAWVGAVAAFFAVATPALGQLQFVTRQRRAEVRKLHRWAGAMPLILLFLNILSGLVLVEVIPNVRSF
jgi:hypothetical protein